MRKRAVRLGDVTDNFDSLRKPVKSTERVAGEFPYYGASGVVDYVDNYIFDGEYLLIAEDGENLRSRSTPIAFLSAGKFWVNNHAHVVRGNQLADTRFLNYLLAITDISGYLTGSAQPKLSRASMDSIQLLLPDLETQRAIAEVLGALDDKVTANNRLITTSNNLAVSLLHTYQASVPLSEIVTHKKSSIGVSALGASVVAHFSLPAFDADKLPDLCDPDEIKSNKAYVQSPSVLISKLNPRFPRVWNLPALPEEPAVASTEFLVLEPKFSSTSVLWAILSQEQFKRSVETKVAGTSGSHQRVKPADLLATESIDPRNLSSELKGLIADICQLSFQLQHENRHLKATRDILLPQLMSGRLRVKEAEKFVADIR